MLLESQELPRVEVGQASTKDACYIIAMACFATPGCPDFEFAIVAGFADE